jgi:methylphosphotriester-DNA--protein-cysteine methyltransferase
VWFALETARGRTEAARWDLENVKFHRGRRSPRDRGWRAISSHGRCHPKEMLVLQVMDESVKRGITGEISMTLDDNFMINRFIEALGASRYKTYRIYRKQLPC